jgi:DNA (cytosine-5)-methyltransferase 1
MSRPRLLDLMTGIGGCAVGYQRAGFDVTGVDTEPQPHSPLLEIMQGDAFVLLRDPGFVREFDAIHASPICKAHTDLAKRWPDRKWPDQITPIRPLLEATGLPYVIENVEGAPLRPDVVLCGSMFGLGFGGAVLRRHRLFELNWKAPAPPMDECSGRPVVGVYGTGGAWTRVAPGGGGVKVSGIDGAAALGIDWTSHQPGLSQAIPPAYTEWIGRQMITHLLGGN